MYLKCQTKTGKKVSKQCGSREVEDNCIKDKLTYHIQSVVFVRSLLLLSLAAFFNSNERSLFLSLKEYVYCPMYKWSLSSFSQTISDIFFLLNGNKMQLNSCLNRYSLMSVRGEWDVTTETVGEFWNSDLRLAATPATKHLQEPIRSNLVALRAYQGEGEKTFYGDCRLLSSCSIA